MRFFPSFIFTAFSIVFAFFCSCTVDNYKVKIEKYADRSFYREEVLNPTYLKGESMQMGDYLGRCINFLLIEDRYIVYNGLVDDYHGHLYDLSKKKLHHFGRVGKGPGELLGIYTFDYHSKGKILWAEDISQSVMIGFELDSILSSPSAAASSAVKFAPETKNMIGLQWTSPDTVIGFSHFEENGRIVVFDSSGKVLGFKGELPPKETEDLPYFLHSKAYESILSSTPDGQYWISAGWHTDWVELYSQNGLIKKLWGPDQYLPEWETFEVQGFPNFASNAKTRIAFVGVTSTNQLFYLLHSGRNRSEAPAGVPDSWVYLTDEVLVLDPKGQLVKIYQLEHKATKISVDSKGEYLYALSRDIPEVFRYRLK